MGKSPKIFVVSGPSGVGKNTIVAGINLKKLNLEIPISFTTRARRKNEIEGRDYKFISKKEFLEFLENGDLLEHTFFNQNYYGLLKSDVNKILKERKNVLAILDIEGAIQVKKHFPNQSILIFIKTTLAELKTRLVNRGQNTPEQIRERLAIAKKELIQSKKLYDYFIFNKHNQSKRATKELEKIIKENLK